MFSRRAPSLLIAAAVLAGLFPALSGSAAEAVENDVCTSARFKASEFAGKRVVNAKGRRAPMTQRAARQTAAAINESDPFCSLEITESTQTAIYDAEYLASYGCLDEANAALDALARDLAANPDAQDVRDLIALADPRLLSDYASDGDYEDECDGDDDGLGNVEVDGDCPWDENDDEFYEDPDCWEDVSIRVRLPNKQVRFGYSTPNVRLRDAASRAAAAQQAMSAVATDLASQQGVSIETLVKTARDLQKLGLDELAQDLLDKAREQAKKDVLDFDIDPCIMSKERLIELIKKIQLAMLLGAADDAATNQRMMDKIHDALKAMERQVNRSRECPRWLMSMKIDALDEQGQKLFLQTGTGTVFGSKKEDGPIVGTLAGLYALEMDCYTDDQLIGRYRVAGNVKVEAFGQRVPPKQLEPWFVGNTGFENVTEVSALSGAPVTSGAGSMCAALLTLSAPLVAGVLPLALPEFLGEVPLRIAADQEVTMTKPLGVGSVQFKSKPDPRGPIIDE